MDYHILTTFFVCSRRLLLSQDHSELYITVAEYDESYERFLALHHLSRASQPPTLRRRDNNNRVITKPSATDFLVMHCYGPWRVDAIRDMKNVCEVLIALSLYLANK